MQARGAWANIKPMPNRLGPIALSLFLYRYRNLVERFFNKLKYCRAIATRYDRRAANYLVAVKLASARIWLSIISPRPRAIGLDPSPSGR